MTRTVLAVIVTCTAAVGCGEEPLNATFTSRVVQHEACTVLGDRPEVCQQAEVLLDLRVRLEERLDDNIWLFGIPRGGVSDRAILGSRDDEGGFLFVEETSEANSATECNVTERIELSLAVDPKADPDKVGSDDCIALLGRETVVTTSSKGCDAVNDPPLSEQRIARRRWESSPTCKKK